MRHPFSLSTYAILTAAALAAPACLAAPARVANPSTCPVELSASQHFGVTSGVVPVGKEGPPADTLNAKHAEQAIDLSMKNTQLQRIVAAELQVHGTSNKSRVLLSSGSSAVLTNEPAADAVRDVHLVSSVPADESRTRMVAVEDLTSVAWVSVIELRYADGSTWHAGPGRECRVTPDPLMLVADK